MTKELTLFEVFALSIIAQHHKDKVSQRRILQNLSGKAYRIGLVIIGRTRVVVTQEERKTANGFRSWVRKLRDKPPRPDFGLCDNFPCRRKAVARVMVSRSAHESARYAATCRKCRSYMEM